MRGGIGVPPIVLVAVKEVLPIWFVGLVLVLVEDWDPCLLEELVYRVRICHGTLCVRVCDGGGDVTFGITYVSVHISQSRLTSRVNRLDVFLIFFPQL